MPTYSSPADWVEGIFADVEEIAEERMRDAVQDAGHLFVGSVPVNGEIEGTMAGAAWTMNRDTGELRNSLQAIPGDVTKFPAPKLAVYPPTPAIVARLARQVSGARAESLSIGTSTTVHMEYVEERYGGFQLAVLTLFEKVGP
jgi:hypothetical protein